MYSLSDYEFELPEENIAQTPQQQRDRSKLLALNRKTGNLSHHEFYDIESFLTPSDVLVVNNTEVIPARLLGHKETGGKIDVLILDYADSIEKQQDRGAFSCQCLIKASKGPKPGTTLFFDHGLKASVIGCRDGIYTVKFLCEDEFESILYKIGKVPLPPYIKRDDVKKNHDDIMSYQTVYAEKKGAIAAPTAGLHFTKDLLEKLKSKGIKIFYITLHVGYGTFLPVRVDDIRDHKIHSEKYSISRTVADGLNQARAGGGRIVAVGTTSMRTLEYASNDKGIIAAGSSDCDLFIYPGYQFKAVDAMITNFHLPSSTLLMLVSAFAGRDHILNAYGKAIEEKYRFYSYGDAMFIK